MLVIAHWHIAGVSISVCISLSQPHEVKGILSDSFFEAVQIFLHSFETF